MARVRPRLVIVSNRVPAIRAKAALAGGLAVALKDAVTARDTLWLGWSGKETESAQAERPHTRRTGGLTLATIDLTHAQYAGFYVGFANSMLWPLFHGRVGQPAFHRSDLAMYLEVNTLYAQALKTLLKADDTVWVHDYQLITCGAALREAGVKNRIGFFLHIPFPPPFLFETLPQGEQLLRSFAAYDVIGVQTQDDADNLNACLARAHIVARAEPFAIGIDPDLYAKAAAAADGSEDQLRLEGSLGGRALILGVDRLDYTKGLPERFRGFAQLLRRYPEHCKHVTFLQVAPVSRGDVAQYRTLKRELDGLAGKINGEFAEFDYVPLRYLNTAIARDTLAGFYRRAAVGLVTPLRDGMNLVAKEYVAAQDARTPGALVLSRFAGAASAMQGALMVNPYDPDEIADALHAALKLGVAERRTRWRSMNAAVQASTAAIWARAFLDRLEAE
jgi:trehalose 6-phosphate synthase